MRACHILRRKVHILIASAALLFLWYKIFGVSQDDATIPVLRKSFINAGTAVVYGPFNSQSYEDSPSDHSITLVTHTSLKNLYHLQITSMVWTSAISVAVWAHGDITPLVELMYLLTGPCAGVQPLSISILVPTIMPHAVDVSKIDWDEILSPTSQTCTQRNIHNRLYQLRALQPEANYASKDLPYPNNQLRNLALTGVKTSHVLVTDIDILPSVRMDEIFLNHIHSRKDMAKSSSMVFVVPVFESDKVQLNQWSIARLLKEIEVGRARPFYGKLCPQCQGATQYTNWISRQSPDDHITTATQAVPYVPGWEPFVIIRTDSHPKYDERFKRFGYNRMSLICELHMSGRTFHVLDNMFLMHDGFKEEDGFHTDKDRELKQNEVLYQTFISELAMKYQTKRRC